MRNAFNGGPVMNVPACLLNYYMPTQTVNGAIP